MLRRCSLFVTVLAALPSTAQADVIYVDDDNCAYVPPDCCFANGTPGCNDLACEAIVCGFFPDCCDLAWGTLCANLAIGLCGNTCTPALSGGSGTEGDPFCSIQTAIFDASDTDEIIVAPGTYFEAINLLGKAVWLHSSDGPEQTIIAGMGAPHVVLCVGVEDADTVLEGFTITGGNATGPAAYGGGMLNYGSSPTVTDCTFIANMAGSFGGGMYNFDSSPTLTDCTFIGCMAGSTGGAIGNLCSNPKLTGCTFTGNTAGLAGGGMNSHDSNPTLINCTFCGNTAGHTGGGMRSGIDCVSTVTDCIFIGNSVTVVGGRGGGVASQAGLTAVNCSFSGNSADRGGGVDLDNGTSTLTSCSISGNAAGDLGGGVFAENLSSPRLRNCVISGNTAGLGGGGLGILGDSDPNVTNCTFSGNSAANGHAVALNSFNQQLSSSLSMDNCILRDGGDEIWNNNGSTVTINYSNVQDGTPGAGNIDADPLFVDADSGDFRLQSGSPAIDAADNAAVPASVTTDFDGNPRFVDDPDTVDTGNGDPPVADMGAFEFQGTPCPWDCADGSADGTVGIDDFLALLAQWGGPGSCDFSGSGVNVNDFLELLGNWGPCP